VRGAGFEELDAQPFDLIINATASGLSHELPPLPPEVLRGAQACYDLAYGREAQAFAQWARANGVARCHSGAGMLVEQAAESFMLWRGVRPETAALIRALPD